MQSPIKFNSNCSKFFMFITHSIIVQGKKYIERRYRSTASIRSFSSLLLIPHKNNFQLIHQTHFLNSFHSGHMHWLMLTIEFVYDWIPWVILLFWPYHYKQEIWQAISTTNSLRNYIFGRKVAWLNYDSWIGTLTENNAGDAPSPLRFGFPLPGCCDIAPARWSHNWIISVA